ncbi:MAG: class I SAM-dependent methyltransferase [Magnetococcales bacterium]|nr:class I SAM-dependent methyltransferase [Magnetococcales bacterium]MBF0114296.1 class I SAM-dependent methyltransferase [Magnetococcales bacterium]
MQPCRLCQADALHPFAQEERQGLPYTIVHCRRCQAVQTLEQYEAVSPDYVNLPSSALDADHLWCQSAHKQAAFQQWQAITHPLWPDEPRPLLDVGCGTGGFLHFAATQGWQPYGFDASAAQASHAQKKFSQVRQASNCQDYLQQCTHPPAFAMITLWDVLEHLRDPHTVMQQLHAALADEGLLFLSIPNAGALFWKRFLYRLLARPLSLDPWEHVFYYAPQTLQHMLPQWGFRVEQIGSVVCYPRPWSLFELQRRVGFALLNRLPTLAPQIYCIARKVSQRKSPT